MKTVGPSSSPARLRLLLVFLGLCILGGLIVSGLRYRRAIWLEKANIEELAAAAKQDEGDIEVFLKLGLRAIEAENWPRAARAYEHACQLAPDRVEAWVGWARSMYEFADFAASDAILSDFISRHPVDATAYLERAALRRKAKRTDKAWTDINEAVRLEPANGNAWALKGDLSIDLETYQDAYVSFTKAKEYLPDSPWPLTGLYHSAFELRELPKAEAAARELRKRFPEMIEGRLYLGEVLLEASKETGKVDEAVRELDAAEPLLAKEPPSSDLNITHKQLMGRAYYAQKSYPKAKTYLEEAVKLTPDNGDVMFFLGRTYRALGQKEQAEKVLREHRLLLQDVIYVRKKSTTLNVNPEDGVTRLELARWYKKRGAYRSALNHYEQLVERKQATPEVEAELDEVRKAMTQGASAAAVQEKKP